MQLIEIPYAQMVLNNPLRDWNQFTKYKHMLRAGLDIRSPLFTLSLDYSGRFNIIDGTHRLLALYLFERPARGYLIETDADREELIVKQKREESINLGGVEFNRFLWGTNSLSDLIRKADQSYRDNFHEGTTFPAYVETIWARMVAAEEIHLTAKS